MLELIIGAVAKLIDKIIPDPQMAAQAKLELLKVENQQALTEIQIRMSAILAEAQSNDPWTSRARPSFLYVMYFMILMCVFGGILGIWYPAETTQAAANINTLLRALPPDLYTLFGMGYLGYSAARSVEKYSERKKK